MLGQQQRRWRRRQSPAAAAPGQSSPCSPGRWSVPRTRTQSRKAWLGGVLGGVQGGQGCCSTWRGDLGRVRRCRGDGAPREAGAWSLARLLSVLKAVGAQKSILRRSQDTTSIQERCGKLPRTLARQRSAAAPATTGARAVHARVAGRLTLSTALCCWMALGSRQRRKGSARRKGHQEAWWAEAVSAEATAPFSG